ncbi:hypothetical protein EVAR_88942_1 [Eumeta japonica]|uniref:Uncharacterized protein n=1 Tax=Eumeta variegata TaxID=151549 RepID=A0A4C1VQG0_EUMVA|nr:hypothetical protein EVAR_88942_1 [Eumeta japonica]
MIVESFKKDSDYSESTIILRPWYDQRIILGCQHWTAFACQCDSVARGRCFVDLGSRARHFAHRASVNMDRQEQQILAWLEEDDLDNIEEESFRNDDIESDAESEHSRHNTDTE